MRTTGKPVTCTGCERCDPAMAARDEAVYEAWVEADRAEEERITGARAFRSQQRTVSPWVQRALSGTLPAKVLA